MERVGKSIEGRKGGEERRRRRRENTAQHGRGAGEREDAAWPPKPKPKPANLYLHFGLPAVPLVSFTNFTFTATAMATRFASRPLHDRPRCFFSPLLSSPLLPPLASFLASALVPASGLGRPRKNKPCGPTEKKHALQRFSNRTD